MIGRRAVVGLSLLSALLLCAFAAQSASAAPGINGTANTCVKEGGETFHDFADEHCDVPVTPTTGNFEHKLIPLKVTTAIVLLNEKVTEETKKSEPTVIKGTVALTKTEIECAEVENGEEASFIHNEEPEAKKHKVTGKVALRHRKCTVKSPAKCTIKEPLVSEANFEAVEELEGPKGEKNAMGVEFIGAGAEETLAEITYEGAECALKGKTFKLKGSAIATSGPTTESAQEGKARGATWVFTPKFKMQNLKLGTGAAELTSILTPRMAAGGNPITITRLT